MPTDTNGARQPLKISDAADYLNISIKTLRRWEKRGLISPNRNAQNHRLYQLEDLKTLKNRKHKPLPSQKPEPKKLYSISEAAQMIDVSIKTIRRWDAAGKINSQRNSRNQRIFSQEAIAEAQKRHIQEQRLLHLPQTPTPSSSSPATKAIYRYLTPLAFLLFPLSLIFAFQSSPPSPTFTDSSEHKRIHTPPQIDSLTHANMQPGPSNTSPEELDIPQEPPSYSLLTKDVEIAAPMTTKDLQATIQQAAYQSSNTYNQDTLRHVGHLPLPDTPTSPRQMTIYDTYEHQVTMPIHNPTLNSLPVIFKSPSGRLITHYSQVDSQRSIWIIRFIPDEPGIWQANWQTPDGSITGSESFSVSQTSP